MTVEALCRRITEFGFTLLGEEFAMDARPHVLEKLSATRKSLVWVRDPTNSMMYGNPSRVRDYVSMLENKEYSYLMSDGGAFQISFIYDGNRIERHRLAYYPCPFQLTNHDLNDFDGGLLDLIQENFMDDLDENVLLRSPIRCDYAPLSTADFHPASHITVNDPTCRIPARAPMEFGTFVKLILQNFYLDAWQSKTVVQALTFANEDECLSDHDKTRAYLNWTYR